MAKRATGKAPGRSDSTTEGGGPPTVEQTVEAIKEGIRAGRFAPGQRLIEADLASEFGLKRGPIREALRILAGDGIVELIPQKGARVRKLERDDLIEMIPVLGGLVHITVRLAIGRLQAPEIRAELENAMKRMRAAAGLNDFGQFQLAGIAYLAILRKAANNRYLDYLDSKLYADLFRRQFGNQSQVQDWDAFLGYFEDLHAALMAGDRRRASAVVEAHEDKMLAGFDAGDDGILWQ